jgi:hypothetical protein
VDVHDPAQEHSRIDAVDDRPRGMPQHPRLLRCLVRPVEAASVLGSLDVGAEPGPHQRHGGLDLLGRGVGELLAGLHEELRHEGQGQQDQGQGDEELEEGEACRRGG